jgi:hypothetical protein
MNLQYLSKYFGKNGITSSQANFIADQIKERNKKVASQIASTAAYEEILLGYKGMDAIALNSSEQVNYTELAQEEGKLYALSAWLREAINARGQLINFYSTCGVNVFGEAPEWKKQAPTKPTVLPPVSATMEDILADFSVAELAEYFQLQACAAHLGKHIHQDGKISEVRSETLNHLEKITDFRKIDDVSYPLRRVAVYGVAEIDEHFNTLQNIHRSFEQKLNNYKARLMNGITDLNVARQTEYRNELDRVNRQYDLEASEYNREFAAYNGAYNDFSSKMANLRSLKVKEVSGWKIIIPKNLQDIYDSVAIVKSE